jgi:hypothetical protein
MVSRNSLKIFFDFLMTALMVMIYSVSATGPLFHEIAGLIIFVLFFIHLFYNRKWIVQVGKKLRENTFSRRQKLMYIIDFLLFCTFAMVGISGMLISKEIFKLGYVVIWRYVHICSSVSSLLLLSIHIGLHGKMIIHTMQQHIKIPSIVGKTLSVIILFIILGVGIYGIKKPIERTKNITVLNLIQDVFYKEKTKSIDHKNDSINEKQNEKNDEHKEGSGFNIKSIVLISSGYLSVIIFCSIMVYIIENKIITKRKNKRRAYCT